MNSSIISKEEKTNRIKSKADLKNIKSYYITKAIFALMKKNKSLKIMKYNKEI